MDEMNFTTMLENALSLWLGLTLWWVTVNFQDIIKKLERL